VPEGFQDVLKDLTREILREQPHDIDEFCLKFFETRLQESNAGVADGKRRNSILEEPEPAAQISEMSPEEIEELIHGLFKEQDVDGNHTLDRHEFKMVFNKLSAKLGLKKNDVRRILAEADSDENGEISYAEFIPVAVSIIETIVAKWQLRQEEERKAKLMHDAELHIFHGMPQEELEEMLTEIFREADADGNGTLDLDEFERCLADIRLGMTRKEINVLMFETYANEEGKIDYEAFKPLCMQLLVELTAQEWMAPSQDEEDLKQDILTACRKEDPEECGVLSYDKLQEVLYKADLGLTLLQICSILSEAEEIADGRLDYVKFAPRCAFMVHACQHYRQKLTEKKEQMQTLHAREDWGMVCGKDRDTLEAELLEAFLQKDSENHGCVTREAMKTVLKTVLPGLDKQSLSALLALATKTETAMLRYQPVVDQAFRTLKKIMELAIIYEDD